MQRVYRSLYVYSVGFHDVLRDVFAHVPAGGPAGPAVGAHAPPSKGALMRDVWRAFLRISEDSLKVAWRSEFLETVDGAARAEAELGEARRRLQETAREADGERESAQRALAAARDASRAAEAARAERGAALAALERERRAHLHAVQKYLGAVDHRNALQGDVAATTGRAEAAEAAVEDQRRDLASVGAERDEQRQQADEARAELAGYRTRAVNAEAKNGALEAAAASAAERAAAAEERFGEAQRKYREEITGKVLLQSDLHYKKDIIRKQASEIEEGVAELSRLDEAREALVAELATRTSERDGLAEDKSRLTDDLAGKANELEATLKELGEADRNVVLLEDKVSIEEMARISTERELAETKASLAEERTEVEARVGQLAVQTRRAERAEAVGRAMVPAIPELTAAYARERSARRAALRYLAESRATAEVLRGELKAVNKALEGEREEHTACREKLAATEQALTTERDTTTKLRAVQASLESNKATLESTLVAREARIEALESELEHARGTIAELEARLAATKDELAGRSTSLETTQLQLHEKFDALEELRARHEAALGELTKTRVERDGLAADKAALEGEVATLTAERDGLLEAKVALEATRDGLQARVAELEADKARLEGEVADLERKLALLGDEKGSLADDHAALQDRALMLDDSLAKLRAELSALRAERDELEKTTDAEKAALDDQIILLTKAKNGLEYDLKDVRDQLRKEHIAHRALCDLQAKTEEEKNEAESMLKQAHAVRSFLQGEIGALKSRVESLKAKNADEVERRRIQQQELDALRSTLGSEMVQLLDSQAKDRDRLMEELRQLRAAYKADTDALKLTLAERERALIVEKENAIEEVSNNLQTSARESSDRAERHARELEQELAVTKQRSQEALLKKETELAEAFRRIEQLKASGVERARRGSLMIAAAARVADVSEGKEAAVKRLRRFSLAGPGALAQVGASGVGGASAASAPSAQLNGVNASVPAWRRERLEARWLRTVPESHRLAAQAERHRLQQRGSRADASRSARLSTRLKAVVDAAASNENPIGQLAADAEAATDTIASTSGEAAAAAASVEMEEEGRIRDLLAGEMPVGGERDDVYTTILALSNARKDGDLDAATLDDLITDALVVCEQEVVRAKTEESAARQARRAQVKQMLAQRGDDPYTLSISRAAARQLAAALLVDRAAAVDEPGGMRGGVFKSQDPFLNFCYDFFLHRFGLRSLAELHLKAWLEALEEFCANDPFLRMMASLIGLADAPVPAALQQDAPAFYVSLFTGLLNEAPEYVQALAEGDPEVMVDIARARKAMESSFVGISGSALAEFRAAAGRLASAIGNEVELETILEVGMDAWASEHYKASAAVVESASGLETLHSSASSVAAYEAFHSAVLGVSKSVTRRESRDMYRAALHLGGGATTVTPEAYEEVVREYGLLKVQRATTVGLKQSAVSPDCLLALNESWSVHRKAINLLIDELRNAHIMRNEVEDLMERVARVESHVIGQAGTSAWQSLRQLAGAMSVTCHKYAMRCREQGKRTPPVASAYA